MGPLADPMRHLAKYTFVVILVSISFSLHARDAGKENVKEITHQFLMCWQNGDLNTFSSLLHKDVVFAFPGNRFSKAQLVNMFKQYQSEKREIKIYLGEPFLYDGKKFATAYQFAATDRETEKRQAVGTGVVGRIKDGKIIEFKEYYDEEVAVLQYAGKLPLDEGQVSPWPASVWLRPETID